MDEANTNLSATLKVVRERAVEGVTRISLTSYEAAWAAMALQMGGESDSVLTPLWEYLAKRQLEDGRVVIDPALPDVHWPTALCVLAWRGAGEPYAGNHRSAVEFLLRETGVHWERTGSKISGHDPSIRGWSWLSTAHSWVEPTSLAIIALKASGRGDHPRVQEAVRMLLDRQLSAGGWNYGNTTVFDTPLRPIPEDTGYALAALAGSVNRKRIEKSLEYLQSACIRARTPSTLCWGILGLSSWGRRPEPVEQWIAESLDLQRRGGGDDIRLLSQLVVAYYATQGLVARAGEAK